MKTKLLISSFLLAAATVNAQSFVAGWDFDGVNASATSVNANWGAQAGSATASWTHALANIPITFTNDFGISTQNNSATINDSFTFLSGGPLGDGIDENTGFNQFSDNFNNTGEFGFQSFTGDDTFTLSFSGTNLINLELSFAFAPTQGGTFTVQTVDLSSFDGVALANYQFTPALSGVYDNFAIVGTVVPEPSSFAAIAGVLALGFVAVRRRK